MRPGAMAEKREGIDSVVHTAKRRHHHPPNDRWARETLKVTQEELADKLRVTQVAVSRLERRSDMHLSTLRQFVRALGGEL
jgi:ribosome-binding protein aMBF1 (putative translation factor)